MTQARKMIVSVDDTPFYHCMSRCVRRAFLCGTDHYSGNDYEHRREWLEHKLHDVSNIFAIRLCAYAIMSSHYHVVLHIRTDIAQSWTDKEVIERWHTLFSGNFLSKRFLAGMPLNKTETLLLDKDITLWRGRLCDISWYMRIVNECIARRANKEDNCTGRFWEGRFKSQALLDEKALLSCMAYVDLNPIRAAMAATPETSEHTCAKARIVAKQASLNLPDSIEHFTGSHSETIGLPFQLNDYLELLDWSGRILREDKRGTISHCTPPILERLDINSDMWKTLTTHFEQQFSHWVGADHIIKQTYKAKGYQRIPKAKNYKALFG